MRQYRSSGSVEGVMGNHDSYSNSSQNVFQNEEHLWSLSKVDSTTGVGGTSDWN
jgi:hypothetical protein